MLGIAEPHDIAGVFDHHVLESATGGDERPAGFASKTDRIQSALQALIRAPRTDEEAMKWLQAMLPTFRCKRLGRQPFCREINFQGLGCVHEGRARGRMRREARIVIGDDGDSRHWLSIGEKELSIDKRGTSLIFKNLTPAITPHTIA